MQKYIGQNSTSIHDQDSQQMSKEQEHPSISWKKKHICNSRQLRDNSEEKDSRMASNNIERLIVDYVET